MTVHCLPPPPAPPAGLLPTQELDTLLPPPDGFFTLPRMRRSVSVTSTGHNDTEQLVKRDRRDSLSPGKKNVHFKQENDSFGGQSKTISSIEKLRRSNSHVESIV